METCPCTAVALFRAGSPLCPVEGGCRLTFGVEFAWEVKLDQVQSCWKERQQAIDHSKRVVAKVLVLIVAQDHELESKGVLSKRPS